MYVERTHDSITRYICDVVVSSLLPLNFLKETSFGSFVHYVNKDYNMPSLTYMSKSIKALYEKETAELHDLVQLIESGSVQVYHIPYVDTSGNPYVLTSIVLSYINALWELDHFHLTTEVFSDGWLKDVLTRWNLTKKLSAIVVESIKSVDPTKNEVDVHLSDLSVGSYMCVTQVLNDAIKKGMKTSGVKALIADAKEYYDEFLYLSNLNVTPQGEKSYPIVDTDYDLLNYLLTFKTDVVSFLAQHTMNEAKLTPEQWDRLELLFQAIKPLEIAKRTLTTLRKITISMVRPIVHSLITKHLRTDKNEEQTISLFKNSIRDELYKHFWTKHHKSKNGSNESSKNVVSKKETEGEVTDGSGDNSAPYVDVAQIASFLDPRFKDLGHEPTDSVRKRIIAEVKRRLSEISCSSVRYWVHEYEVFFSDPYPTDANEEMVSYLKQPQLHPDLDPCLWWRLNERLYPCLSKLAKAFLCIPTFCMSLRKKNLSNALSQIEREDNIYWRNWDATATMRMFMYENSYLRKRIDIH